MTARCALYARLWPLYFARILILNEFKLWKFCLFLQEWGFGRSRSSEVIDFGANRKRVCDFLLVRNSNLGPILYHFGDFAAVMCSWPPLLFYRNFGVFPLHQIAHVGVSQRISLKLFGREIIFEGRWSASQTDRRLYYTESISHRLEFSRKNVPTFYSLQYRSIFVEIFLGGRRNFCSLRRGGVLAVQGHPRSMNLVPIESAYTTSY